MKGYLVQYSTGTYDNYKIHNACVTFNEELAKQKCKEIDDKHRPPQSMFTREKFSDIEDDTYGEILSNNNLKLKDAEKFIINKVMKLYPEWDRKTAKLAIEIERHIEDIESIDYDYSFYSEIEIFE